MAFDEFTQQRIKLLMADFMKEHRPAVEIRSELDFGFRIEKQSVIIFTIRPHFLEPTKKIESSVAKTTFVRTQKIWDIYWQRANLKWCSYEPVPQVESFEDFLKVVVKDEYHCFWG